MLRMVNFEKLLREVGLIPTMNQNRFGWWLKWVG
jgi:hypothetical protein